MSICQRSSKWSGAFEPNETYRVHEINDIPQHLGQTHGPDGVAGSEGGYEAVDTVVKHGFGGDGNAHVPDSITSFFDGVGEIGGIKHVLSVVVVVGVGSVGDHGWCVGVVVGVCGC